MKKSNSIIKTQKRKKQMVVERFGGKCQCCGYDKCLDALEFHHLDENTKEHKPAYIIIRWSFEKAKKELDKCILVCANCHREIHAKNHIQNLELQNKLLPWITKICLCCLEKYDTKSPNQKYCSHKCSKIGQRKVARPSRSELKQLLDNKIPFTQLGKKFGVSDNAVRKWCKKYELI